jgi:hypothetical protein
LSQTFQKDLKVRTGQQFSHAEKLKEVSTVPIKPVMERDLGVDTTPGQSRGVQGLFDGAVEIDLSSEEAGHI